MNQTIPIWVATLGAILLVVYTEIFKEYIRRSRENYFALIRLERLCNSYLDMLSNQAFEIDSITKEFRGARRTGSIPLGAMMPQPFWPEDELLHSINEARVVNIAMQYFVSLRKLNRSIGQINEAMSLLRDVVMGAPSPGLNNS